MTKDMPLLGVLATYTPSGSKELVVLFQASMMGNACNGGPLFFVRFKSGGAFVYSDPFDHCGGPDPKLTRRGDVVRIRVPSAPPNRGTGIVPGQEAEYDLATGVLTQRVLRSP